ncbi:hypothetical protein PROVALCAL_00656, partial [Providencia alcalifaciens DSM 30120]
IGDSPILLSIIIGIASDGLLEGANNFVADKIKTPFLGVNLIPNFSATFLLISKSESSVYLFID